MPFAKKRERSPSTTPVPSTEAGRSDGVQLPDALWEGMQKVLNTIYDYRTEDGLDPSKLFHRKVNKRVIPEYYDTIKEPIALSTIKQKIHQRTYRTFGEYVRDFALIPHNAQVFNRVDSGAFQDALIIKDLLQKELQGLMEKGLVKQEDVVLPDLGEIPTYEEAPIEEPEAEEEESDDEGEEDEEEDEDEGGGRKKRRGPRSGASIAKRGNAGDEESSKARGRPPKLLTPMEARILAVLKGIRKPKNSKGYLMIKDFDRLPDKQAMPEYYAEIKNPMAYDLLKRKVKRKKYKTLEDFMSDVNLMFNNAKEYNQDDSQVFKHAQALQVEAGRLYDVEKAKSDADFADDEGKIPVPDGILHNGELYKVGDWVHIQNPNDLTKPIPAQIYRTYRNPNGQAMVNVCWYYRPEQTVHRFDKHFLANEIVKTGRYRDHQIEEVEGRCFVMFTTRYFKGRPRGLPPDIEVYVCEARYNEERHQFNKIKTWASCLPDEVRDKDYEMDLFDRPRKMKKFPSPIAYLLKDDQKETGELPKVTWGAEGAPPKIGAVHKLPRGEKDSPPPEPTPPPPPKRPTPPRQIQQPTPVYQPSPAIPQPTPRAPSTGIKPASYPHSYAQTSSASPAPAAAALRQPSAQPSYTPATPQQPPARPQVPQIQPSYQPQQQQAPIPPVQPGFPPRPPTATGTSYRDPPPIEVYVLPDQANLSIPHEIRERYQRDEQGRVLFFTAPPVIPDEPEHGIKGHSVRYIAALARRQQALTQKRKQMDLEKQASERTAKKARLEQSQKINDDLAAMQHRALASLEEHLAASAARDLNDQDLRRLANSQNATLRQNAALREHERQRSEGRQVHLGTATFADDWDNRVS